MVGMFGPDQQTTTEELDCPICYTTWAGPRSKVSLLFEIYSRSGQVPRQNFVNCSSSILQFGCSPVI